MVLYCDHESIDTHTKAFVPFSIRIQSNRKTTFLFKDYILAILLFWCDFVGLPVLRKMNTIRQVICGTFILSNNYLILQSNIALYRYSFDFCRFIFFALWMSCILVPFWNHIEVNGAIFIVSLLLLLIIRFRVRCTLHGFFSSSCRFIKQDGI